MQYANIIVDHKGGYEPFTYAIPANLLAHLDRGSVVLVPVGRQIAHGVITQFVRYVAEDLAPKLKPIQSVVYSGPFVPEYILKAVEDLHSRFGYGRNELLGKFIPELPKRRQTDVVTDCPPFRNYQLHETILHAHVRSSYSVLAKRLADQGKSMLVICQSLSAVHALAKAFQTQGVSVIQCPESSEIKARREYFLHALQPHMPTIFIGTRGALITPLNHIGTVIIDEPWLPGHKEDNSPKLWSCIAAQALCKARGIPLHLFTSCYWPETRLLDSPKSFHQQNPAVGDIQIIPKRPLHEILTQFLADSHEDESLAVFVHESKQPVYWCPKCRIISTTYQTCTKCGGELILLPAITTESLEVNFHKINLNQRVSLYGSDEIEQFIRFDRVLALNFDVYLSIADFRTPSYLRTLIELLRGQAKHVSFVTAHPDQWVRYTSNDYIYVESERDERKAHHLPPYSFAVQLAAKDKGILEKTLKETPEAVIRVGKIHSHRDEFRVSLLSKLNNPLPKTWHRTSGLKIDFLPNYIE